MLKTCMIFITTYPLFANSVYSYWGRKFSVNSDYLETCLEFDDMTPGIYTCPDEAFYITVFMVIT